MTTGNGLADQILVAAAANKGPILEVMSLGGGRIYRAGNRTFGGDSKDYAAAKAGIDHLVNGEYIKKTGTMMWELTDKGWKTADALNKAQEQTP